MITQVTSISPALLRLLAGSIDYAGVFPPSSLPLSNALTMFKQYIQGPDSWIIGSVVLPIELLSEVGGLMESTAYRLTVIPGRTDEPAVWLTRLQEDVEDLRLFLADHPQVTVQALELALPSASNATDIPKLVEEMIPLMSGSRVFLELPTRDELFGQRLKALVSALESRRSLGWGLKLRMGGPTPEAFPSVSTVAEVLATVRNRETPIKFTAGLHHPLRHWDRDIGVPMHGFINVLMAALFAHACRLPPKNIEAILGDENSKNFAFKGNVARWQDLPLRAELIEDLRRLVVSFGSCSVDEPLSDLRTLGWLP
jgi:hypothetical protein